MIRILLLTVTVFWSGLAFGQLIQKEDGRYYDAGGNLYSGSYFEYYPSGVKRIEMNVLNGWKEGETKLYYENGNLQEVRVQGQCHGWHLDYLQRIEYENWSGLLCRWAKGWEVGNIRRCRDQTV